MTGAAVLLVVAKAPVPGLAKTRLQSAYSPEQAADLAAACLLDTLDAVARTRAAARVVALTGDLARASRRREIRAALAEFVVVRQRGIGLAERLIHAHLVASRLGQAPVLQIGTDTPQVTPALLGESAELLLELLLRSNAGAVLGPAADGGWWALGLTSPHWAHCLRTVQMSRLDTHAQTLTALLDAGATVHGLPELTDVDRPSDVVVVAELVDGTSEFRRAITHFGPVCRGKPEHNS